jgi:hypothetical protein
MTHNCHHIVRVRYLLTQIVLVHKSYVICDRRLKLHTLSHKYTCVKEGPTSLTLPYSLSISTTSVVPVRSTVATLFLRTSRDPGQPVSLLTTTTTAPSPIMIFSPAACSSLSCSHPRSRRLEVPPRMPVKPPHLRQLTRVYVMPPQRYMLLACIFYLYVVWICYVSTVSKVRSIRI